MSPLFTDHPRYIYTITQPKTQVILSLIFLCSIVLFASFRYIFQPYDGIDVYQEAPAGEVYEVYLGGPAHQAGIQVGDLILAIDDRPVSQLRDEPRYRPGLKPGDTVEYLIQRGNEHIFFHISIGSHLDNLPLLGSYLGIQFLSIGLWIIGLVLVLFVPHDDVRARLLGLGFLTAGLTAAVGYASGWNSFWGANTIQKVLLSLLAPILVASHLSFPTVIFPKIRNGIIHSTVVIAIILATLVVVEDWLLKPQGYILPGIAGLSLRQLVLIFFMAAWLLSVLLMVYNRLLSKDAEVQRQTGIIIWGMLLGIGPFFVLTVLPYILFHEEYLPGAYTILFLIILPLAYTYVIFQRKLLKVDFIINRIVVWFTLILLILIASILLFGVFVIMFNLPAQLPIYGGVVAVLIALPITTLSKVVQQQVDRVLYGSHYDFTTVTGNLSHQLAQTLDRNRLVELLTVNLPQQMGIKQVALFLAEENRQTLVDQQNSLETIPLENPLCPLLLKTSFPIRATQLWSELPGVEQDFTFPTKWAEVYAPLIFNKDLLGILILGRRMSGDVYSDQDMQIIATVTRQGALATTNVMLVDKLHGLAQQLVRSSDEERKRLASELHDTVLQELFYIKQGLHNDPTDPELQDYLEDVIQKLRQAIKDQRPPILDGGLAYALESLVHDMQKQVSSDTSITWSCNLEGESGLSDEQSTSIFRIAQEALRNAVRHAQARNIQVMMLRDNNGDINLKVQDDGIGANWTREDGELNKNHFGLVLMQERATMINAKLHIFSLPGEGTTIDLEVSP